MLLVTYTMVQGRAQDIIVILTLIFINVNPTFIIILMRDIDL
jgi:hypothetical protein